MSRRIEVLVESVPAVKLPIAVIAIGVVSWGIQMLLQCSLTHEGTVAVPTVLGHCRFTIATFSFKGGTWKLLNVESIYPAL